MATQPLEDVAEAGKDGPLQLFQLYVIKDRKFCKSLIQRKHTTTIVTESYWLACCSDCLFQSVLHVAYNKLQPINASKEIHLMPAAFLLVHIWLVHHP